MNTIPRNNPCHCGSGKRYKHCHGSLTPEDTQHANDVNRAMRTALMRNEARQKEVEKQFDLGRPPISFEVEGYKIVAVGNELQWSKKWKTFPDFLMDYFKKVMGADWGKAELAKGRGHWSPLFDWYARTCDYQKTVLDGKEAREVVMIGAAFGAMWLTYGLYLLRHNAEIQERLLERLRSADPVQVLGAVQEVLVAAAMIRAGFDLTLEDETDGTTTHCEFVATSKATGKAFSVEIKVCDPGRMEGKQGKSRTVRQLSHALSKKADHPRLVWIDLNRAPLPGQTVEDMGKMLSGEMRRIATQAVNLKVNGGEPPPAYVVLSNWPFRHQLDIVPLHRAVLLTGVGIAGLEKDEPFHPVRELAEFREKHADAFCLMREFAGMAMPQTLDGSLPSKTFGKGGNPIQIGDRYIVPTGDGAEKPAELLSADVIESDKTVFGLFRLDEGPVISCTMPLSDDDLTVYRNSPETFFGKYEPRNKAEHPVELYEHMLKTYRGSTREKLLEFMKGHSDMERLKTLSQEELAKIYVDGVVTNIARTTGGWKSHAS